jgi:hypothetical protein
MMNTSEQEWSERRPLMARKYSSGTGHKAHAAKSINDTADGLISGPPSKSPRHAAIAALNAISAQPFFARENGIFESILARDSVGRAVRSRIMLGWGVFSLSIAYACLRFVYSHSSAESFFIGALSYCSSFSF